MNNIFFKAIRPSRSEVQVSVQNVVNLFILFMQNCNRKNDYRIKSCCNLSEGVNNITYSMVQSPS